MERTNEIIAGNIKNLRKASGMTQSDLAEKFFIDGLFLAKL